MICAAGRIRRVAGNLRRCQRLCVLPTVDVRAEGDGHEMIGHRAVQIMLVGENACRSMRKSCIGLPWATIHEPFGASAAAFGKTLQNVGDGMNVGVEIPAVDQLHLRGAFFGQMNVGVRKSRNRRSTSGDRWFECPVQPGAGCRRNLPVATMRAPAHASAS